jgi:aminoglycoside phosphotransferase (APT) family kinase protein
MRETWERQRHALQLDQVTLKRLLQPLLAGSSITSAEFLRAGRNNTLYKITAEGREEALVLRFFQDNPAACKKEVELFNLLHSRVPLAEILWADQEGHTFVYPYTISRWVEGILVEDILVGKAQADLAEVGYNIGVTLAAIGSSTFAHPGFFHDGLHLDGQADDVAEEGSVAEGYLAYLSSCIFPGKAERWLGAELTARLWSFVTEYAHLLQATAGSRSLVHADFGGSNLLAQKERGTFRIVAVLDWEFAFVGSSLFDLGNLFRYEWLLPDEFEAACLQGYVNHGGVLPPTWKKITRLFDLINICTFLQTPEPRGSLVEDMISLIRWTLEHWDTYQEQ